MWQKEKKTVHCLVPLMRLCRHQWKLNIAVWLASCCSDINSQSPAETGRISFRHDRGSWNVDCRLPSVAQEAVDCASRVARDKTPLSPTQRQMKEPSLSAHQVEKHASSWKIHRCWLGGDSRAANCEINKRINKKHEGLSVFTRLSGVSKLAGISSDEFRLVWLHLVWLNN